MDTRIASLKEEWESRQQKLGNSQRAVLFKRFPGFLNESIHRRHMSFVRRNIPKQSKYILDVGCGYGRIAQEVQGAVPEAAIEGIELSPSFAAHFARTIGRCFNGPVQDFIPSHRFDTILIVTLLMYLDTDEISPIVKKMWEYLLPGGRIICIEPAMEILTTFRRLTGRSSASPTGGSVRHFSRASLEELFAVLPGSRIADVGSVHLVPPFKSTAVHHGIAVEKVSQ